jgi:phospholipid/cholesterol/gamma-HCH transport system ATP-binding protein
LADLHRELGLTIVMVSHDLDSVAALANRAVVLAEGRILLEGSLEELADPHQAEMHETIRRLLAGPRGAALRNAGRS